MKETGKQKRELLQTTIDTAADCGLSQFSLRHLANAAGASTTTIFQNFSGKAELLENALNLAIQQDQEFHKELSEKASVSLSTHISFADFLAQYIRLRAGMTSARFTSEILLNLDEYPTCHEPLQQWHLARTTFWTALLEKLRVNVELAQVISQFVLMEEYYAYALRDNCTYGMLLAETCRALCDTAFRDDTAGKTYSHVSLRLAIEPLSTHDSDNAAHAPVREQLLQEALRIIEQAGIEGLNQRKLAKNVGVSTSAIAYYFNDMKTFRNEAIWRALVNGIPSQLDPSITKTEQPQNLVQWLSTLDAMLDAGTDRQFMGFYVSFARLTGQACLLSQHDSSLLPLIEYLRALEGWGTYRVSRNIDSLAGLIGREHAAAFGVWIKAEAIMRRVNVGLRGTGMERLQFVAEHIFPRS